MISFFAILAVIALLFVMLLATKSMTKKNFCVVCASVSLTWITLLALLYNGFEIDRAILGVLIGESIVGLYYLVERHARVNWLTFRLPFLLTLTTGGVLLIRPNAADARVFILLAALWLIALAMTSANHPRAKKLAQKLIACCKNW